MPEMSSPLACVDLYTLQSQEASQGAVSVLFQASDCERGEPVTGLMDRELIVRERGQELAAGAQLITSRGSRVYVTLLMDMSGDRAADAELIEATKALVTTTLGDPAMAHVRIGVELFDGSTTTQTWLLPTADLPTLITKIEALSTYSPPSPDTTNLHGALTQSIRALRTRQQQVIQDNIKGVMTSGYVLLFTANEDTSGALSAAEATPQITSARQYQPGSATVQTLGVVLERDEDHTRSLVDLLGEQGQVFTATTPDKLTEAFVQLGAKLRAQIGATYMLSYCASASDDVDGDQEASVGLMSERYQGRAMASFTFNARGFTGICDEPWLQSACLGKRCGTSGCGACDDATEVCSGEQSGQCVDACLDQGKCGGELVTNTLGYELLCTVSEELGACSDQCVDLMSDDAHCGACDNACRGGMSCQDGACIGATQLSVSDGDGCVLHARGTARCWGSNTTITNDDGTKTRRLTSKKVPNLYQAHSLKVMNGNSCALLNDDTTRCWGRFGADNQPVERINTDHLIPEVINLTGVKDISSMVKHSCALRHDGSVYCWGNNEYGQLGDGTYVNRAEPTKVEGLKDVEQLILLYDQSCALVKGGSVYCWGLVKKYYDEMTQSHEFSSYKTPTLMPNLTQVKLLRSGIGNACALIDDGTVYCWGSSNNYGQLGGRPMHALDAIKIYNVNEAKELVVTSTHACVIHHDTSASCWGKNRQGQLGDGTQDSRTLGVKVTGLTNVKQISFGVNHTCALLEDETARCWGENITGQLGDGTNTDSLVPVVVNELRNIKQIALGLFHSCALLHNGTVHCWGDNANGQLGDGSTVNRNTPTPLR